MIGSPLTTSRSIVMGYDGVWFCAFAEGVPLEDEANTRTSFRTTTCVQGRRILTNLC